MCIVSVRCFDLIAASDVYSNNNAPKVSHIANYSDRSFYRSVCMHSNFAAINYSCNGFVYGDRRDNRRSVNTIKNL